MSFKKIGVVVAIELDAVLSKYGEPCEKFVTAGYEIMTYTNDSFTMYVVQSGAGEIAAAGAAQLLISVCNVDMILNFGVVGSLTEEIATAEACVVEKLVHYDFTTKGWINLRDGQYPGYADEFVPTDAALCEKALEVCPELKKVVCASADKFVDDADAKRLLRERFGADICEMESAGIVLTANRCKVPCLIIKAVSDSLTGGGKEFFTELQRVSLKCFDIADKVIRSL